MLTVKNGNNFDFVGRYDGVDYQFPQGMTTALPDEAAKHIFGVGLADKQDVLVRHGWMTHTGDMAQAMEKLNGFSFNVANELNPGDIIESLPDNEQGSAPLQIGSGVDGATDGAQQAFDPTSLNRNGGSILDKLTGA